MDQALFLRLMEGLDRLVGLQVTMEDAEGDKEDLAVVLKDIQKELADIVDIPGQLLEQIDEILT